MHGFRTSRALIIDDNPQEALPVITALGALGVASVYHDAAEGADYSRKHSGVRLLFLDMVLENRGAMEGDPDGAANILVGVLGQLLEESSDPLVVVCWTKHNDFKDSFKKTFSRAFPKTRLDDVLLLNKHDWSSPEKRVALLAEISRALDELRPLSLLLGWEQTVHDAATHTTRTLSSLVQAAASAEKPWNECAYTVCAALALAERGSRLAIENGDVALAAFRSCLTALLADRLEHYSSHTILAAATVSEQQQPPSPPQPKNMNPGSQGPLIIGAQTGGQTESANSAFPAVLQESKLIEGNNPVLKDAQDAAVAATKTESTQKTAALVVTDDIKSQKVVSGTIAAESATKPVAKAPPVEQTAAKLLDTVKQEVAQWKGKKSLLSSSLRAELNSMLIISSSVQSEGVAPGCIFAIGSGSENSQVNHWYADCCAEVATDTFDGQLPSGHLAVIIEMTPTCDFAQAKSKLPRFVSGFLVPEGSSKSIRKADYIRRIGPLLLKREQDPKLNGVYFLGINAHFAFSLDMKTAKELKPFLRLRSAVFSDALAWVCQQAGRLGYTSIGP